MSRVRPPLIRLYGVYTDFSLTFTFTCTLYLLPLPFQFLCSLLSLFFSIICFLASSNSPLLFFKLFPLFLSCGTFLFSSPLFVTFILCFLPPCSDFLTPVTPPSFSSASFLFCSLSFSCLFSCLRWRRFMNLCCRECYFNVV